MSFTSAAFAVFAAVLFVIYYLLPGKWQWMVLLAGSCVFYLFSGPKYIIYVAVTALVTYAAARLVGRSASRFDASLPDLKSRLDKDGVAAAVKKNAAQRRLIMAGALTVDFGILAVLKYLDFLIGNVNSILSLTGNASLPLLSLVMPLGLSFYTFSAVGYVIDVNRRKYAPEPNFARFALYLTFFPQIIQGPIPRYDRLAPQFAAVHRFDYVKLRDGFQLVLWGAFKKLVIADALAPIVINTTKDFSAMSGLGIWCGMFVWGIQLYTDFSGGIDMARGIAGALGIELDENFKRPYFATDLTDYWNRWHITLGDWLRDYFFYPVALSKRFARFSKYLKNKFGKFIAKTVPVGLLSLALFTLIGIWHGANWGEVLFGVFNGTVILISTLCEPLFRKVRAPLKMDGGSFAWRLFRILRTFLIITVARVLSRATQISDAWVMLGRMFTKFDVSGFIAGFQAADGGADLTAYIPAVVGCLMLLVVSIIEERGHSVRGLINSRPAALRIALEVALIAAIFVFGAYGIGYDAGGFIYGTKY